MLDFVVNQMSSPTLPVLMKVGLGIMSAMLVVLVLHIAGLIVAVAIDGIFDTSLSLVWHEAFMMVMWTPAVPMVLAVILLRRSIRKRETKFYSLLFDPPDYWLPIFKLIGISVGCSNVEIYTMQNVFGAKREYIDGEVTYTVSW